ncbi:hypothetical protein ACJRO7_014153 [Eucalyptus globulus]|uniref:Uncharacterized protein n=1 Tax=Eucalyptus globulus TaxID=34317 RepID=A0ABD3L047_EUCGL
MTSILDLVSLISDLLPKQAPGQKVTALEHQPKRNRGHERGATTARAKEKNRREGRDLRRSPLFGEAATEQAVQHRSGGGGAGLVSSASDDHRVGASRGGSDSAMQHAPAMQIEFGHGRESERD